MSIYQSIAKYGPKLIKKSKLFKWGFNLSPMYRRSTAKIKYVSDDLLNISVLLPISYKNRNYMNSIFGGSMFSAVDPIPMVQLINLLDGDYVVWDKSAEIIFKKPAKESLYADFQFTRKEVEEIIREVEENQETELTKTTLLTNKSKSTVYCEVRKKIYVAQKAYYKEKRKMRSSV